MRDDAENSRATSSSTQSVDRPERESRPPCDERGQVWRRSGLHLLREGDYPGALRCLQQAEELLRQDERQQLLLAWTLEARGCCHDHLRQVGTALQCFQRAIGLFAGARAPQGVTQALRRQAELLRRHGHRHQAIALCERALELCRRRFDQHALAACLVTRGGLALPEDAGTAAGASLSASDALVHLSEARRILRKLRHAPSASDFLLHQRLTVAHTLLGDRRFAAWHLRQAAFTGRLAQLDEDRSDPDATPAWRQLHQQAA